MTRKFCSIISLMGIVIKVNNAYWRYTVVACVACSRLSPYSPVKSKYTVVVSINGNDVYGFLLNSKTPQFIQNQPRLHVCEIDLTVQQQPWMTHNSHIDCTRMYSFTPNEFNQDKGVLPADALTALLKAVRSCPMLKRKEKNMVLVSAGLPPNR